MMYLKDAIDFLKPHHVGVTAFQSLEPFDSLDPDIIYIAKVRCG
jgi:hypothetical protein